MTATSRIGARIFAPFPLTTSAHPVHPLVHFSPLLNVELYGLLQEHVHLNITNCFHQTQLCRAASVRMCGRTRLGLPGDADLDIDSKLYIRPTTELALPLMPNFCIGPFPSLRSHCVTHSMDDRSQIRAGACLTNPHLPPHRYLSFIRICVS